MRRRLVVRAQERDGAPARPGPNRAFTRAATSSTRSLQLAVLRDERAARRRELGEGEAAAQVREPLEGALDREEPLLDALGVVEAVDADAEQRVLARGRARRAPRAGTPRTGGASAAQRLGHSIEIGYGRTSASRPAMTTDCRSRSMRASRKRSTASTKLLQKSWVWKPTMLEPSMPSSSSFAHGQIPNALRVRPRDVPEGDDGGAREPLADHPGHERVVVVLHEDDGVAARRPPRRPRRRSAGSRARTGASPRRGRAGGCGRCGRAARAPRSRSRSSSRAPPPRVSHTRRSDVGLLAGRHADAAVRVHDVAVRAAAAVGDPHAAAGAHHRLEGGDEAARRVDARAPARPARARARTARGSRRRRRSRRGARR